MAKGPENIGTTSEAAPATPASPETRVETSESAEERQRRQREEAETHEADANRAEADLDGETETATPAGENPPAAAGEVPKTAMDSFAEMLGKVGDFFGRIGEAIGKAFSKMKSGSMKGLLRFGEMAGFGWAVEFLKPMVEPAEIREVMQRKFPQAEVKEDPANDAVSLQTLHSQYESKLTADKNDGKNYSFITFYTEKVGKLASGDGAGKTFTLADLTTVGETPPAPGAATAPGTIPASATAPATTPAAGATQSSTETAPAAAESTSEINENMKKAGLIALFDAFNNMLPAESRVTYDPKADRGTICNSFIESLENGKFSILGLEIDGGYLEANDEGWIGDHNLIEDWVVSLRDNPRDAIVKFMNIDLQELDETSANSIRTIKGALQSFLDAKK